MNGYTIYSILTHGIILSNKELLAHATSWSISKASCEAETKYKGHKLYNCIYMHFLEREKQ